MVWRSLYILMALLVPRLISDAAEAPAYLPRYAIDMQIQADTVKVSQTVAWTNHFARPADEVVFNVHSHFTPPTSWLDKLFLAKMLEIMRVAGSQGLYDFVPIEIESVYLVDRTTPIATEKAVPFAWDAKLDTALHVQLARQIHQNDTVELRLQFTFKLPQRQGRWGQWKGVTFLSNWLPVVAYYDESGFRPTPFVAWHQPWFNEAGVYNVRVKLPADQKIACTGTVAAESIDGAWKTVIIGPVTAREFTILTSARFEETSAMYAGVKVKCLAFPEHAHYAKVMVGISGRAIETYSQWFGKFPYPEFTIVESYFGWNGNECSDLIMIDERVFGMPHSGEGYAEYLVSHETCHQWFYNAIGTDGYRETFMDEAFANHFAHKLLDKTKGKNNTFIKYPDQLEWLPNIRRDNYRFGGFYTSLGRDELGPALQEMEKYEHIGNLFSSVYDRGAKILNMIEARLGEERFIEFIRHLYSKYYFKVLLAKDFQTELEAFTGQDWSEFFATWMHTNYVTDWSVEEVEIQPVSRGTGPVATSKKSRQYDQSVWATVRLKQSGKASEQTHLGFAFDDKGEKFNLLLPVAQGTGTVQLQDPPGLVQTLEDGSVLVRVQLPAEPTQIMVDPDHILPDANPGNNCWKRRYRINVTPVYTFLDELSLTADYDRYNISAGPWIYEPTYNDPWFTRASVIGARIGAFRNEIFYGGAYIGYRSDFRDVALGIDGVWDHLIAPKTQIGVHAETSLFDLGQGSTPLDRVSLFTRYVFTETASNVMNPTQYVELFTAWQNNYLLTPRYKPADAERFNTLTQVGAHYHLDLLTPYFDPETGFRLDTTYANGIPILGQHRATNQFTAQISAAQKLPEGLGWLGRSKIAGRLYGAYATPKDALLFTLGGNQLFRGFDNRERQGSRAWIASLEWRVPIMVERTDDFVDHFVGLRNAYIAPFYDVGDIYVSGHSQGPVAHAIGVGLRLDVAWFSFIERTMIRLDVAKTVGSSAPAQFWFGIQHPF